MIISNIELEGSDEIVKRLKELRGKAPQALCRAINDAVSKAFTEEKKVVSKKYNVSKADAGDTLKKVRASRSRLKGVVISKGERITLYKFNPIDGETISVAVKRGGAQKNLDGNPKAFIAKMDNGHIGIFERKGEYKDKIKRRKLGNVKKGRPGINKHNERIYEMHSLSVPQMLKDEELMGRIEDAARDKLYKRLDHHINYILGKG